jgi:hypothetical protein
MKKKIFIFAAVGLFTALITGELLSRYALGLGDPPLSVSHSTIEYMFKPSSEYHRFGNYFKTNSYGMRSEEFSQSREKNEVRILVLGDSVPNGGNLTDQNELATELLRENITKSLSVPVIVGNISAGTWSPPNMLAYIQEFGTFGADAAIVILNKGDMFDFPTFSELNPNTHPTEKPKLALGELVSRYIAPRLIRALRLPSKENPEFKEKADAGRKSCTPELLELLEQFSKKEIPIFVLYHPSEDEILQDGSFSPRGGYSTIVSFTQDQNIKLYSLAANYGKAVSEGKYPFRDTYHPNSIGQKLIANFILTLLESEGLISQWSQRR